MEISRTENAPAIVEAEGTSFTGVVRNLRRSQLQESWSRESGFFNEVISFRLELSDANGDITGYVPVEMRGKDIFGDVAENDRVSVDGRRNPEGILTTSSFTNLTTGSRVYVNKPRMTLLDRIIIGVFLVFFLSIFLFIAHGIISDILREPGPPEIPEHMKRSPQRRR